MSGLPAEGPWVPGMTAHTVPAVKKREHIFSIAFERKREVTQSIITHRRLKYGKLKQ